MTIPKPRSLFPAIGLVIVAVILLFVRAPGEANGIMEMTRMSFIAIVMMGALALSGLWLIADLRSLTQQPVRDQESRPALETVPVLTSAGTDCPLEVQAEIALLWGHHGLGNDNWYFGWESGATSIRVDGSEVNMSRAYPTIDRYLKARGVSDCLIHHWW